MTKKEISKKDENEIKKEIVKEIKDKVLNDLNKDIKSSIIDTTKKYREELKEEIANDINEEITTMMRQEEKRMLRSKNFSLLKKNIVILVLFTLLLYFGYCLYDVKYFNFMKSECEINGTCVSKEENQIEEPEKKEEVVKDKVWYKENYGYLLDEIKLNLSADNVNAYYLYSSDYKLSDIKPSYLLNMAYKKLDSKMIKVNSVNVTIDGEDLRNAFQELFGSLTYYKESSFSYNCLNFIYNKEKDRYVAESNKCSNKSTKHILEEIDDMYEEGEVLYIMTTATIYNEDESSFYTFDRLFEPTITDVTDSDLVKNSSKLNKYQYQFKKSDEIYYLDSIVKLK